MANCHLDSPMNIRSPFLVHTPPASIHFKVFGCISWIYMLCVLKAPQPRVSRTPNFSWFLSPSFLPSHLTSVLTDLLKALILLSFFPSQKPKQGLCSSWPSTASHQFLSMSKVFTLENVSFFSSFLTLNGYSYASPAHPTVRRALVSAVLRNYKQRLLVRFKPFIHFLPPPLLSFCLAPALSALYSNCAGPLVLRRSFPSTMWKIKVR